MMHNCAPTHPPHPAHLQQHGLVAAVVLWLDQAHRGVVPHHKDGAVEEVGLLSEQRGLRAGGSSRGSRGSKGHAAEAIGRILARPD